MKLPQTTIRNEKTQPLGWDLKVQNILVSGLKTAEAFSNPGLNEEVAYSILGKNSQVASKAYSIPELATSDININICLHSSTLVGGAR